MKGKLLTVGVLTCLAVTTAWAANDDANSRNTASYLATASINQAMQGESAQDWMKRTTVNVSFQKNFTPQYEVETIQPITKVDKDTKDVVFTQGRVAYSSDLGTTANIGVGYRHLNDSKTSLVGVNAFVDHGFRYGHSRMSAGVEYFHGQNEFRMNVYKGLSGAKEVDTVNHIFEKVVDGYDLGYAHTFENAEWAKAYVNLYRWDMKQHDDAKGVSVGAELQLTPNISLDLGYNKVNSYGGNMYGKIMYRLGESPVALWGGAHTYGINHTVESKLLTKVRRQNNIIVETSSTNKKVDSSTIQYVIRVV